MINTDECSVEQKSMLPQKRKVAAIVKQLEALKETLSPEVLAQLDAAELSVRLQYVTQLNKNFDDTQSILEENDDGSFAVPDRFGFTSLYFEVKAMLDRQKEICMSARASSTFRQFSVEDRSYGNVPPTCRKARLPKIELPKFAGSYMEWPNFYALFSTVIDESSELSDLEKFHYLRSSLSAAALNTISSLDLKAENYREALNLLINRFENKLLHFQAHIREIAALKVVESGSVEGLRSLSDKLNSHLRALHTIAEKENIADGLMIYLATIKMDLLSRVKWEESLKSTDLPSWSDFASFLEDRCKTLENLQHSVNFGEKPQIKKQSSSRFVHISSSSNSFNCFCCEANNHFIPNCTKFIEMLPSARYKEAKRLKLCLNCLRKGHILQNCTSGCCRKCSAKHHTLLHLDQQPPNQTSTNADNMGLSSSQAVLCSSNSFTSTKLSPSGVLLATASILVKNNYGIYIPCRAILDSGSQLHLVTSKCVSRLHIKCNRVQSAIAGIGDGNLIVDKSADICFKSRSGGYSAMLNALVVPIITHYKPDCDIAHKWKIPPNIHLSDPAFYSESGIDLLIGAELFFELMCVGQIKLANNEPILQKTVLGWVVAGGGTRLHRKVSLAVTSRSSRGEESLSSIIKSFWEVENCFETTDNLSASDRVCETHFTENTTRLTTGAYSVRLPQIDGHDCTVLGDSYQQALHRFLSLERKFKKHPDIKQQYAAFMREYIDLDHMSKTILQSQHKQYFLPHHCVLKLDSTSTKLRVVFDGSAKTSTGISLNDVLHAGPTIQPKLFDTLLSYRFFKTAISGDICKMYRCVRVTAPDDLLQCVLWRESPEEEISVYKLDTVTYGTRPAAFLAIRSMQQLAADEGSRFPLGAKVLRSNFYVDDMLAGGDTVEEVIVIRKEVTDLLAKGNFLIRKWCSNDDRVLADVVADQREGFLKLHDGTNITKSLGLIWEPSTDSFIFSFSPEHSSKKLTKRTILSAIARLYDPLGLIGPIITKAKIFMQALWKLGLNWDESLPQQFQSSWNEYISAFSVISRYTFPRYVSSPGSKIQIHAFCDASLAAYGVCIYVRTEYNNNIKVALLCSKSRVSPVKTLTVPKLELCAASLLAELVDVVVKMLSTSCQVFCWSDSMVVLSWLREHPSNFNIFVANRVSRIQSLTSFESWHHVPTDLNPADILSRGATPAELLKSAMWSCGPSFLQQSPDHWPISSEVIADLPERRKIVLAVVPLSDLAMECKYHNSFLKMQRIFAYVYKFLHKVQTPHNSLTPAIIKSGTILLIKSIQLIHFAKELKALKACQQVSSSSKLSSLSPILDSAEIIRVGGRLHHSNLDYDAQHPVILPKGHVFTDSMIRHFHEKLLHAGTQSLLAAVRQQYWPIGGRKYVSSVIGKCLRCYKMKPQLSQHIMGSLPADRVRPSRPFTITGIDFCGPFFYKSEVRSRPAVKCYIAIFVCFATKATHLELVQDLSTTAFLSALKRFVSLRGKPATIWSDNATNFVGAKNELQELKQLFHSQQHNETLYLHCLEDGIEWKFIPPRSPHFGGLWEAAVKAAKYHFYRAVGLNTLSFEELRTLVCQISAILNSRPLCPITEDPNDLDVLTPGHFLVGGPLTFIVEPDVAVIQENRLNSWQKMCDIQQNFWRKWNSAYLSLLQERSKWRQSTKNITAGALVILKDENTPSLKWQVGRVKDVILGNDGVGRVVVVRTAAGIRKRCVTKVAVLPIDSVEPQCASTEGGC